MFLQAGANLRSRRLGIRALVSHVRGGGRGSRPAPAELTRFDNGGDLAWFGYRRPHFLVWGEQCVFHDFLNRYDLGLSWSSLWDLPRSPLEPGGA